MSLEQLHKSLLTEFRKEPKNVANLEKVLNDLQKALGDQNSQKTLSLDALSTIHCDFFEIRVLFAILKNDMKTFEKAITDVQSFYTTQKTESANKYLMIGLYLMFLLVNDKLSDFHMLIEQINQQIQQTNPYIRTPVELEQFLMEGAYNKIFLNQKTIPSPYYAIFVQILTDTVRGDIAVCIEKAYKRIPVKDAIQMLLFDNESAGLQFAEKRGWKKENNMFCFESDMIVDGPPKAHLDTERISKQVIYYAKQLEMIV